MIYSYINLIRLVLDLLNIHHLFNNLENFQYTLKTFNDILFFF